MTVDNKGFFDEAGVLSRDSEKFPQEYWNKYPHLFELAYDINRYAHGINRLCKVNGADTQHLTAICLYLKILNSFAAATILIERKLEQDAEAICRVSLEAMFYLKRVVENKCFVNEFIKSYKKTRLKLMNLAKDKKSGLHDIFYEKDPLQFEAVYKEVSKYVENEKVSELKIEEIAKKVKLHGLYNFAYRTLSQSVHSTAPSLSRYLKLDDQGQIKQINVVPEPASIPRVLSTGIMTLLISIKLMGKLFELELKDIDTYDTRFSQIKENLKTNQ